LHIRRVFALAAVLVVGSAAASHAAVTAPESAARTSGWCAGSVSWKAARSSVGQVVRVKARVASVAYARTSNGKPTFINLGAAYPNPRRLTILIWGRNRVNFPRAPERMFRPGQMICAQGRVTLYRGVAEIEVALWDAGGRLLSF
jgi:hypothetical protein